MSSIDVPLKNGGFGRPNLVQSKFGETKRKDNWWVEPALVCLGYLIFIVYANYAILQNANYEVPGTGYLSPMYSPLLFRNAPMWWPALIPYSAGWNRGSAPATTWAHCGTEAASTSAKDSPCPALRNSRFAESRSWRRR